MKAQALAQPQLQPLPINESTYENEELPDKSPFVIVYAAVSFSGFLVGLFCGWVIWG